MARKKKKRADKRKPSDLASVESTARKLQSLLNMPEMYGFMRSGFARGVREKILSVGYQTIRNVVDQVPLISAIINTRVEQMNRFLKYTTEKGQPGYEFYPADPTKETTEKDQKIYYQLGDFLDQTGLLYDPEREDDFADYIEMLTRETLTIDQIATEMQRNRKGEFIAFWLLDGASIKRVDPKEFRSGSREFTATKDTKFCQIVEDKITNLYTADDLIFDYKNKRSDLRFRGFGFSAVEQCINMVTTLLFGYNYLRDQLMRDRVPKGFIQVMGDVGRPQLDAIRDYWYAAMSGAGGQWNIPILPSGKDGIGLDWKNIQTSNREMEYHKLMMFVSSIIAAVFSMDLAEMGIKTDDSTSLIGESSEPRIQASKDRGLAGLLAFIEQHINKIIRKINEAYKFRFVGLEREDETKLAELRKKEVETRMTINELREADGMEPLKDEYADVVLNPQSVQIYNAAKMSEQGGGPFGGNGNGNGGEEAGGEEEGAGEEGAEEETEVDWSEMYKSLSSKRNKTIKVVIP